MSQGSRRQSRTYALQVLYAADVAAHEDLGQAARTTWDTFEPELDMSSESIAFAETLLGYVSSDRDLIDGIIAGASKNWRLERMSRVDRNILRLAVAEMRSGGVPHKVVINEAVELAKRFGTEDSAAFINGILDRVAHDLGERTT